MATKRKATKADAPDHEAKGKRRVGRGEGHFVTIHEPDGGSHAVFLSGPPRAGMKHGGKPAGLAGKAPRRSWQEKDRPAKVDFIAGAHSPIPRKAKAAPAAKVAPPALKPATRELLQKHRRPAEPASSRATDWLFYPRPDSSYRPKGSGKTQVRTKTVGGISRPETRVYTVTGRDALGRSVSIGVPTERQARAVQGMTKAGASGRAIDRVVANQSYTPERQARAAALRTARQAPAPVPLKDRTRQRLDAARTTKGFPAAGRKSIADQLRAARRPAAPKVTGRAAAQAKQQAGYEQSKAERKALIAAIREERVTPGQAKAKAVGLGHVKPGTTQKVVTRKAAPKPAAAKTKPAPAPKPAAASEPAPASPTPPHPRAVRDMLVTWHGGEIDDRGNDFHHAAKRMGVTPRAMAQTLDRLEATGAVEYDPLDAVAAAVARSTGKYLHVHKGRPVYAWRVMRPKRLAEAAAQ